MKAFQTKAEWRAETAATLVIHCSDGRFQALFGDFVRSCLKVESFDRLAVPGGPQFLAAGPSLLEFESAGRQWTQFLAHHHATKRVICIGHDDCGWYKSVAGGHSDPAKMRERQTADLHKAADILRRMLPGANVESYFAEIRPENRVRFVEVVHEEKRDKNGHSAS